MFEKFLLGRLLDEGGVGDGGGTGAGTGDHSGAGGDGAEGSSGITKEFLTSSLNSVSAGLRSELSKKTIPNALKASLDPVLERVTALEESLKGGSGGGTGEGGEGGEGGDGHKIPPEVQAKFSSYDKQITTLQKALDDEKAEKQAAKEAQRVSDKRVAISTALGGFVPKDERAARSLQKICETECFYSEDGDLVALDDNGNETTAEAWIKEAVPRDYGGFLAPVGARGSGAGRGANGSGKRTVSLEDIKPGMKPEEKQRIYSEIAALNAGA